MIDVIGYENLYTINTNGDVYSVKRNKYLKHFIDKDGFRPSDVCTCCKHLKRHKTHMGFKWEYV